MPFEVTQQNVSALEPLFKPWEEPAMHRLPNPERGKPAIIAPGRRPSKVPLVRAIRAEVDAWRRNGYAGAGQFAGVEGVKVAGHFQWPATAGSPQSGLGIVRRGIQSHAGLGTKKAEER